MVGQGRIAGVVFPKRDFMIRLDYDQIPESGATPVLHLNIGKTGRGQSAHIPLSPYKK